MANFQFFITHFGYVAVFTCLALGIFGLPMPDEMVVTSVGYFSSTGLLHVAIAIPITLLGVLFGTAFTFYLGKTIGQSLLEKGRKRFGISKKLVERTERWLLKHGPITVFFSFFIPGMRHVTCYLSGVGGMRPKTYFTYVLIGASLSTIVYVLIGYYIGIPFHTKEVSE